MQEWALIVSRAVDAYRYQGLRANATADSQGSISDLSLVFAHQLQQWRMKTYESLQGMVAGPKQTDGLIGLYERYGRLVIQSLALQQALTQLGPSLPSCFLEVSFNVKFLTIVPILCD